MNLCPMCGTPYDDKIRICPNCGNAVGPIPAVNPEDTSYLYGAPVPPALSVPDSSPDSSPEPSPDETPDPSPDVMPDSSPDFMPGLSPDEVPVVPIWVIDSKNQPADSSLDESFLDDPSFNAPVGEDSYLPKNPAAYDTQRDFPSGTDRDTDIFDEVADSASLIFSNMSPKIKKFVIITIITTLLSIIPFIYMSCTHQSTDSIISKIIPAQSSWPDS